MTRNWPQVLLRLPNYRRARARMLELGREVLRGGDRHVDRRSDLLADLRKATEEDPNLLGPEDLRMAAMGPFVAGLDTVSNSCAFLLYALLKEPEAYRRVSADADRLFAGGGPTAERLQDLPALRGAVQEALRLYPIAPVLVRHVRQPFEFGGFRLAAGEAVLIASTIVHFMAEHFPDPYKFDIDRHRPTPGRKPVPLAGFGLGPHTCLGSGFAEEQMALVIATLLHHARFSLDPAAGRPTITRDPSPTLGPRYTVRLDGFRRAHAPTPPVAA